MNRRSLLAFLGLGAAAAPALAAQKRAAPKHSVILQVSDRDPNRWQLALNNAFGKDYETAWYYNQPGRNYMLTLRYQPAQ